jgi:hypothetical protein
MSFIQFLCASGTPGSPRSTSRTSVNRSTAAIATAAPAPSATSATSPFHDVLQPRSSNPNHLPALTPSAHSRQSAARRRGRPTSRNTRTSAAALRRWPGPTLPTGCCGEALPPRGAVLFDDRNASDTRSLLRHRIDERPEAVTHTVVTRCGDLRRRKACAATPLRFSNPSPVTRSTAPERKAVPPKKPATKAPRSRRAMTKASRSRGAKK